MGRTDQGENRTQRLFTWHAFDVRSLLPHEWAARLLEIAAKHGQGKVLIPRSVTSREDQTVQRVPVTTVGGVTLKDQAQWLSALYLGRFRLLAERAFRTQVDCAQDERIGVNLNIQRGHSQRYEAHVDSNPIEGLLYVTTHPVGAGGELVVSNSSAAIGLQEIEQDCSVVYPVSGQLIFFDARMHPHYVRPLTAPGDTRVVVAMNFYTEYCTEDDRPADLNRHLFGSD